MSEKDKIICILERGFRKIALPSGYVINIDSCDNGCDLTSENMQLDVEELNKYIGLEIYWICLDDCRITKGFRLGACSMRKHSEYDYDCFYFNSESIVGDNRVIVVN